MSAANTTNLSKIPQERVNELHDLFALIPDATDVGTPRYVNLAQVRSMARAGLKLIENSEVAV